MPPLNPPPCKKGAGFLGRMKIQVVTKSYYGNIRYQITDHKISRAVARLSGKKTIGPREIEDLKDLGFEVTLKPQKEIKF